MAPRQPHKDGQSSAHNEAEEEADEPSSYDSSSIDMMKKAQDIVSSSKKRRDAKRKVIDGEHEQKTQDVAVKISTLFETRKNRATKFQMTQWDRLDALNKKRSSLESLILASMRSIEQHSVNISNEMGAMFGGRIEEIQESSGSEVAKDL